MSIAMNMQGRDARRQTTFAVALLALVGCAESDLPAQHERALGDALHAAGLDGADASSADGLAEPPTGAAAPRLGDYTLVFAEEFDTLALDASRWDTRLPWGQDFVLRGEHQYYVDTLGDPEFGHSPFALDGDTLTIAATRTPAALADAADGQPWLSGALSTAGLFETTYGFVEMRMALPAGQGVSPGVWMLAAEEGGLSPQLHVLGRDGARPDSVFHDYEYVDAAGQTRSPERYEVEREGLSEGFHTFAVSWSPGEFLFLLDGEPRYRIVGDDVSKQSMYLVLGLAIDAPGDEPEVARTPETVEWVIDYVRVWQRTDAVE